MTRRISISFGAVEGTAAGLGHAGPHCVIADRPEGVARGRGLGFNGGELMAAALGGCLWNDLHYVAEDQDAAVRVDEVEAEIELAGTPPRVVRAQLRVALSGADEATRARVFDAACADSTIANSVAGAFPVRFERKDSDK